MKSAIFALLATLSATTAAQAAREKIFTIDMTGARFQDDRFNLMGDGMEDSSGIQIKVTGEMGKAFTVKAEASDRRSQASCSIGESRKSGAATLIQINADPETDSGDTCDVTVTYKSGKKATLMIESTGT